MKACQQGLLIDQEFWDILQLRIIGKAGQNIKNIYVKAHQRKGGAPGNKPTFRTCFSPQQHVLIC